MTKRTITVVVQGTTHAGKGCALAAIAHFLQSNGVEVVVQGADSHNKEKLERPDEALLARLRESRVVLTELQTSR